ncbi:[Fe-S]-dependent transcriptional repressor FeoC [Atlantibacter hermannii]|uniref:[Fe-S]-dependent transcriptional repressor FeoC n=1 Tax=Atlantibacter hermannii TaxID=565 RepID=UPI0029123B6F|nr:[Fe-S]-dependent transcriptional repressor FeoC [Atlantibacter hermannii]MDU7389037.1 [Fe-S]-dependent transcriptional repressor FeoC [Atlantibacter hermannii]
MATLIEMRDLLALQGRMEASRMSERLATPLPLINAMLARLEAMGRVKRVTEDLSGCLSGSCKRCPEGNACQKTFWTLQ